MLANLVIVFFFISGNEPNTSDYTELVKTTSTESTHNIIYSIIRMKDVLSGGERERGEKEINSTTLRKCSEKDTNEILTDNRYGRTSFHCQYHKGSKWN